MPSYISFGGFILSFTLSQKTLSEDKEKGTPFTQKHPGFFSLYSAVIYNCLSPPPKGPQPMELLGSDKIFRRWDKWEDIRSLRVWPPEDIETLTPSFLSASWPSEVSSLLCHAVLP